MMVPPPAEPLPAEALGHVHFVGIGGAGLSGVARIMLARGIPVSGSDACDSDVLTDLRALGATCWVGHAAEQVAGAETVVVSTAVGADNPEVVAALRHGLRLLPRSAALQAVMHGRRVVAVAGTHGKTTTTALLAVGLVSCGADPSYAVGAELTATSSNAHDGTGDIFVAEADESDGAFLTYSPFGAVVTNVEADHLDVYGTQAAYRFAFERFLDRIDRSGFLVICSDDHGAARLGELARAKKLKVLSTGLSAPAQLRAEKVEHSAAGSRFAVRYDGRNLGEVRLPMPGCHYVQDALCALGAGLCLGFDLSCLRAGLRDFGGARRRMEPKGEAGGVQVYDSYAHHPTEIAADLAAARVLAGGARLVVCFQPHLVSRTKIFAEQMGAALAAADRVVVMDVYVAREQPEAGITGRLVAASVPRPTDEVTFESVSDRVAPLLSRIVRPGDVVLTLGAGDVTLVGPALLRLLRQTSPTAKESTSRGG